MNLKLIEGALGMLARLVPPEEYAKATGSLAELAQLLKAHDARMARIEKYISEDRAELVQRVQQLEWIVHANVPGAEAMLAEQAMWMRPGAIDQALALAEPGKMNGEDDDGR